MKEIFQQNEGRKQWLADVVSNPAFKEACVFAIGQFSRTLGGTPGDELRLKGGVEMLKVLSDLPLTMPPKERTSTKLDYDAR